MNLNVLVIDDSLTVQADLHAALTTAGFRVLSCKTTAAAWDLLTQYSFATVILDVNLPDGDGIALLDKIKRAQPLSRIPVIILSTEAEAETRIRGMAHGAYEYIDKPYDRAYLIRRVRDLCKKYGASSSSGVQRLSSDQAVLLIDGGTAQRDVLLEHLRADHNEVVVARTGEEALAFLAVHPFGSIVLDAQTMGGAGFDLCRRIKGLPGGSGAHLIILTADEAHGEQAEWEDAGADEVVQKTPSFGLLSIRLRTLWRDKRRAARLGDAKRSTGS
jgi:DNA-binding response OmpR family regulator